MMEPLSSTGRRIGSVRSIMIRSQQSADTTMSSNVARRASKASPKSSASEATPKQSNVTWVALGDPDSDLADLTERCETYGVNESGDDYLIESYTSPADRWCPVWSGDDDPLLRGLSYHPASSGADHTPSSTASSEVPQRNAYKHRFGHECESSPSSLAQPPRPQRSNEFSRAGTMLATPLNQDNLMNNSHYDSKTKIKLFGKQVDQRMRHSLKVVQIFASMVFSRKDDDMEEAEENIRAMSELAKRGLLEVRQMQQLAQQYKLFAHSLSRESTDGHGDSSLKHPFKSDKRASAMFSMVSEALSVMRNITTAIEEYKTLVGYSREDSPLQMGDKTYGWVESPTDLGAETRALTVEDVDIAEVVGDAAVEFLRSIKVSDRLVTLFDDFRNLAKDGFSPVEDLIEDIEEARLILQKQKAVLADLSDQYQRLIKKCNLKIAKRSDGENGSQEKACSLREAVFIKFRTTLFASDVHDPSQPVVLLPYEQFLTEPKLAFERSGRRSKFMRVFRFKSRHRVALYEADMVKTPVRVMKEILEKIKVVLTLEAIDREAVVDHSTAVLVDERRAACKMDLEYRNTTIKIAYQAYSNARFDWLESTTRADDSCSLFQPEMIQARGLFYNSLTDAVLHQLAHFLLGDFGCLLEAKSDLEQPIECCHVL